MALYGLERGEQQGARDALDGAKRMLAHLGRLNERLNDELDAPLRIGIGVHTGEAIVGTMGPPTSPNYSAIGGGDGGTLREVLRHPIRSATMVELDVDVVRHCREHMPSLSAGAFDDPRTHLLFGDGAAFVADTSAQFDVIIIDSTDPIGPGRVLFEEPFFHACNSRLRNGGIMVNQNGTPAFMPEALRDSDRVLGQVFNHHGFFYVPVPTYVSGVMALGWASDSRNLAVLDREWLERRAAATRLETRWYTPATHLGAFAEPPVYTALRSGR